MRKFLSLNIYKAHYGECSNGGLSSKYHTCYIECPNGFLDEENVPADAIVKLEKGPFGTWRLVPETPTDADHTNYMFGGCYVGCSDSRWSKMLEKLGLSHVAIALHDRTETWKEYDMYSK